MKDTTFSEFKVCDTFCASQVLGELLHESFGLCTVELALASFFQDLIGKLLILGKDVSFSALALSYALLELFILPVALQDLLALLEDHL